MRNELENWDYWYNNRTSSNKDSGERKGMFFKRLRAASLDIFSSSIMEKTEGAPIVFAWSIETFCTILHMDIHKRYASHEHIQSICWLIVGTQAVGNKKNQEKYQCRDMWAFAFQHQTLNSQHVCTHVACVMSVLCWPLTHSSHATNSASNRFCVAFNRWSTLTCVVVKMVNASWNTDREEGVDRGTDSDVVVEAAVAVRFVFGRHDEKQDCTYIYINHKWHDIAD